MEKFTPLLRYRAAMTIFIIGLVMSGVTAFPLLWELRILHRFMGGDAGWISTILHGLEEMYGRHPWIAYGTDWLAFGHIVIAMFFVGPLIDPVTSKGNLIAGIAACLGVIPLAMICGPLRDIPMFWRLIDCSFGVIGIVPLVYCLRLIPRIKAGG
jgi:succinate-acetate transporter protein